MPDLIEDMDGSPLPEELQRGGAVYNACLDWVTSLIAEDLEWPKRTTDDLMIVLAPFWSEGRLKWIRSPQKLRDDRYECLEPTCSHQRPCSFACEARYAGEKL